VTSGSNDETRTTTGTPGSSPSAGTSAGWLSSSGSIDHGRFSPGALLDGRYRIVGLLGRGGMGEVYRADDLRLGQAVAIKFLPGGLGGDTHRLAQFHNEVRMARQVSHANVCRVHDIGEIDGQLYLTMEFVDGEDLAASLKRVGRFPEDKAIDLSRQIAAGLAAAHSRGVIHRDLKPANIMLDKEGKVRLMDFGLAAAGTADDVRAGTPAYMAPEQLLGKEVTARSDIFALGLVLYELFTGKRAFTAKTIADLVSQHETSDYRSPSELVKGLDPAIDQVILQSLDRDPSRRPSSALAVSAALPGGDPLASALAAGETPSPEMVAAAGKSTAVISPLVAGALVAITVVMLAISAVMADRVILFARTPFERAPASLFDRARDLEKQLGYTATPGDTASGLVPLYESLTWLRRTHSDSFEQLLAAGTPPALLYWYRSAPALIVPTEDDVVSPNDPVPFARGLTMIVLDTRARLFSFSRVPTNEAAPVPAPAPNWQPLFDAAGLDPSTFSETAPLFTPRLFADVRTAWTGASPDALAMPLRIEAGAFHGKPVYFNVLGPWDRLPSAPAAPAANAPPVAAVVTPAASNATSTIAFVATALVIPAMMTVAAFVARANLRKGRGDRKGAIRLAVAVFALAVAGWVLRSHHVLQADIEINRFFRAAGGMLWDAILVAIFYLAAEPHVRRIWPHMLITWQRLVGGSVRDALVGRDLLIGLAAGVLMTCISYVFHMLPDWLDWPPFDPRVPGLAMLIGTRYVFSAFLIVASNAMQNAMLGVLGLAMFRLVLKRQWIVFAVATAVFAPLAARGQFQSGNFAIDLFFGVVLVAIVLGVIIRFGLFAGIVAFIGHFWTYGVPLTSNTSQQYFQTSLFAIGIIVAMALVGFVFSQGARERRIG
jgi:hypothetical protein